MKPLFSVACIMRNESAVIDTLGKSLQHFLGSGGEWIIADTGSTDDSVAKARSLGATVHEIGDIYRHTITKELADSIQKQYFFDDGEPFIKEGDTYFDFASARNHVASLATNNYVSFADCDESFTTMTIEAINFFIEKGNGQFQYDFVFSHFEDGSPNVQFTQSKFYDKTKMKWKGVIHEYLDGTAQIMYLPKEILKLEHFQNRETNRNGYLAGLAVDCLEHPDSDRNSHYFARELMYRGYPHSSIHEFKRHISMGGWDAERGESYTLMGNVYNGLGMEKEAIDAYNASINAHGNRREPYIQLARLYLNKNDFRRASSYAAATLYIPRSDYYANTSEIYTYVPHEILYISLGNLGQHAESKEHFDKVSEMFPNNPRYIHDSKYYYEYPDHGIRGYMSIKELNYLYGLGKKYETICEIGSWCGRSTHALLSGERAHITAVDHFNGSKGGDLTLEEAKHDDIYGIFMQNVGSFENLSTVKSSSEDAAMGELKDSQFDCVFIDAEHTYEGLKKDIEMWKPKAKNMICGHDYLPGVWDGVVKAVDEAFGKPDELHGTIWVKYL